MNVLDDIGAHAEGGHRAFDDAKTHVGQATVEAAELGETAAGRGWVGVAEAMDDVQETLEVVNSAIDDALTSTREGIARLSQVRDDTSSDELARELGGIVGRFDAARTAAAGGLDAAGEARLRAQQAGANTVDELLDSAEDELINGRETLAEVMSEVASERSEAAQWAKASGTAPGPGGQSPSTRSGDKGELSLSNPTREVPHPTDRDGVSPQAATIARHARRRFDDGALDHHVRDVPVAELDRYVEDVLEGNVRVESKYDADSGRVAHWDPEKGAIVIENGDAGTVFTPHEGRSYFDDIW